MTTVELMPIVAAVDERHLGPLGLTNYWRYNPIAWLAPAPHLAPGGLAELAACVRALHAAGLEVIQDIVLNHSGEGDAPGPTLSLRGLDNASYYRLRDGDAARYVDDTGCGNTLALDRPPVLRLALDSLRHFAQAAGVDGFRFDLATTLGRRADGFDRRGAAAAGHRAGPGAARAEADRRALGRRPGRLPARRVSRRLGRMERQEPRRGAPVLARRRRHDRRARDAAVGVVRHLRGARATAVALDQFRHRA